MNPETQPTRAKTTRTSVDPQDQATADNQLGEQDQRNSGDVGLAPADEIPRIRPAATLTPTQYVQPVPGTDFDGSTSRGLRRPA
jgi:hypothetical protein